MKKMLAALAGAACLLCSAAANATPYQLDFTAAGSGAGILRFTAASLGSAVTSIDAAGRTIDGHAYTVSEIGADLIGNWYGFGAIVNGVGVTNDASDDVYPILSDNFNVMAYAVDQDYDTWVTQNITASFSEATPAGADVPEPGATALLGLGLAGLTLARRRLAGLS